MPAFCSIARSRERSILSGRWHFVGAPDAPDVEADTRDEEEEEPAGNTEVLPPFVCARFEQDCFRKPGESLFTC
jgi:hypothetical protein